MIESILYKRKSQWFDNLQVGDIISYKGTDVIVRGVKKTPELKIPRITTQLCENCLADSPDINPLPLSDGILLKAGFKDQSLDEFTSIERTGEGDDLDIYIYHDAVSNWNLTIETLDAWGTRKPILRTSIQYVHELQHAIAMCRSGLTGNF